MSKRFREMRFRKRDEGSSVQSAAASGASEASASEGSHQHSHAHTTHSGWKQKLHDFYFGHSGKMLWVSLLILVLCLAQIGYQIATTGDFMNKGVSLQGGVTVSFSSEKQIDLLALQEQLVKETGNNDITVKKIGTSGVIVEAGILEQEKIDSLIGIIAEKTGTDSGKYSVEIMGSSLGKSFFRQAFLAMAIAFVLMSLVVFVIFRTFVPSLAVILAAFSDIVFAIAAINLMGIKISTAGIAALLMLIGYSVDTDILLTIRVLKRKEGGSFHDRVLSSIKTGMTMTMTAIASTIVVLIFSRSEVLTQIMTILLVGLIADMIFTWIQNVGILKIYTDRKHKSGEAALSHESSNHD
jgi:preprotein translocase subunit SecF